MCVWLRNNCRIPHSIIIIICDVPFLVDCKCHSKKFASSFAKLNIHPKKTVNFYYCIVCTWSCCLMTTSLNIIWDELLFIDRMTLATWDHLNWLSIEKITYTTQVHRITIVMLTLMLSIWHCAWRRWWQRRQRLHWRTHTARKRRREKKNTNKRQCKRSNT